LAAEANALGDLLVEVVNPVPLKLDAAELAGDLKPQKLGEELVTLFDRVAPLIEPKAAYTTTCVSGFEDDLVYLENGHALRGIVLRDMLDFGQEIIPYVVTIGPKLEGEISKQKNLLHSFLLETIGNYALHKACGYLRSFAAERLGTGRSVSDFSPGTGTGELFDIEQQKPLFRMLNPATTSIGVHLTPSLLMVPRKSESGVLAATRQEYVACAHCPREPCESRSVPFVGEYQRVKQT
jgi:hypothetical protein